MRIRIIDFQDIPIKQEDETFEMVRSATLAFFDSRGKRFGGLRVIASELEEFAPGCIEGDELVLVMLADPALTNTVLANNE